MNLLLRAGLRSGRAAVVPAVVAVVGTVTAGWFTFRLGLIDVDTDDHIRTIVLQIAGVLLAHLVLFIALFSVAIRVAFWQGRVLRTAEDQDLMVASARDESIINALPKLLDDHRLGISRCFLFGSIIHEHPTRDVDTIIQFSSLKPRSVRKYRMRLYNVERQFQNLFDGLMLNLTLFLSNEDEDLHEFLQRAGKYKQIV